MRKNSRTRDTAEGNYPRIKRGGGGSKTRKFTIEMNKINDLGRGGGAWMEEEGESKERGE